MDRKIVVENRSDTIVKFPSDSEPLHPESTRKVKSSSTARSTRPKMNYHMMPVDGRVGEAEYFQTKSSACSKSTKKKTDFEMLYENYLDSAKKTPIDNESFKSAFSRKAKNPSKSAKPKMMFEDRANTIMEFPVFETEHIEHTFSRALKPKIGYQMMSEDYPVATEYFESQWSEKATTSNIASRPMKSKIAYRMRIDDPLDFDMRSEVASLGAYSFRSTSSRGSNSTTASRRAREIVVEDRSDSVVRFPSDVSNSEEEDLDSIEDRMDLMSDIYEPSTSRSVQNNKNSKQIPHLPMRLYAAQEQFEDDSYPPSELSYCTTDSGNLHVQAVATSKRIPERLLQIVTNIILGMQTFMKRLLANKLVGMFYKGMVEGFLTGFWLLFFDKLIDLEYVYNNYIK